ncbi:MAG TPA: cohesin domain-containing protein [Candidatus Saccharimonadales bacterium]|jgi:hypothetical protein
MPSKPTKSPAKSARVAKASKVSSKSMSSVWSRSRSTKSKAATQKERSVFTAGAVLAAAMLVSISLGLADYDKPASLQNAASQQKNLQKDTQASLSLKPLVHAQTKPDNMVTISLYANSQTQPVNAVQGVVRYPSDKLKIVDVKTATAFPQEAATDTTTPGLVRFARSVEANAASVTGENQVVTFTFKALKEVDLVSELTVDWGESYLVRSTDNQNILGQSTGSMQLR